MEVLYKQEEIVLEIVAYNIHITELLEHHQNYGIKVAIEIVEI